MIPKVNSSVKTVLKNSESVAKKLIWDNKQIRTNGDIFTLVKEITKEGSPKNAGLFLKMYKKFCNTPEIAKANIRYVAGRTSNEVSPQLGRDIERTFKIGRSRNNPETKLGNWVAKRAKR